MQHNLRLSTVQSADTKENCPQFLESFVRWAYVIN